jgi:hypothetical protein
MHLDSIASVDREPLAPNDITLLVVMYELQLESVIAFMLGPGPTVTIAHLLTGVAFPLLLYAVIVTA